MDLFVINRYTGDDPSNENAPDEAELRKNLLQKIKERKRLSQAKNGEVQTQKKRKKIQETEEKEKEKDGNEGLITNENNSEAPKEIKKKSKKILNENQNESENNRTDNVNEAEAKGEGEKESTGFTVLGNLHMTKKEKIKRKLPVWLANPSVVSVDLKNLEWTVDSIPQLDKIFVDLLKKNNITHFFPVQSQVIPWILKNSNRPSMLWPNDVCVSAPTGSGKTLAFVLPILQVLYKRVVPRIRAVVVLPVQDLANQVYEVFQTYSEPTNLKILLLSQKTSFKEEQQLICKHDGAGYTNLVDIIVTTPGRFVEHIAKTKGLDLKHLKYLVIDEADRVMDNIQNNWLYHLNKHINSESSWCYQIPVISYNNMVNSKKPPNKLLFSATLSQDPEKIQQFGLFQPKLFTSIVKSRCTKEDVVDETKFIGKYTTPAELTEYYTVTTKAKKPLLIHHLLTAKEWKHVLCFVNCKNTTTRLAYVLKTLSKGKIKIGVLSASLTMMKREEVLKEFSEGSIDVLVSSDALARGIDIPNVRYVLSYDAPKFIKTYVHRIGRTGRAGKEGTSLVLLTSNEVNSFQNMIKVAGKDSVEELKLKEKELERYESSYESALNSLKKFLESENMKQISKEKQIKKVKLRAGKRLKTSKVLKVKSNIKKKKKQKS